MSSIIKLKINFTNIILNIKMTLQNEKGMAGWHYKLFIVLTFAVFFLFSHQDVILLPIVCTLKNILHPISVIGYVFMHYYPHPSSYDF